MPTKAKAAKTGIVPTRETDLYEPVRNYLAAQGYTVRAEVKQCDITATKDDELIIIELKRRLNLELLIQAAQRQRITDSVYVAVPRPGAVNSPKWRGIQHVLRRLELGLILVSFSTATPLVEVAIHPLPYARRKQRAGRRAILQEMAKRSGDYNQGGSTRRKLVTAYRESALRIACYLDELGPQPPRKLRDRGAGEKTRTILYSNVYGWFDRLGYALYGLNAQGKAALDLYPDLRGQFREELRKQSPPENGTDQTE